MKIKIPAKTSTKQYTKGKAGGPRSKHPSHIVFVPDFQKPAKLMRIGVMFRFQSGRYKGAGYSLSIDDDPRAKKLAYENLNRIVILPYRGN